jgi:hypothetical protein
MQVGKSRTILKLPTHIVVHGKPYPLIEESAVDEHNERCMRGEFSAFNYILPNGKRLADATRSERLEAKEIKKARAEVATAYVQILRTFNEGHKTQACESLFDLCSRFELWPPLDASGLQ